MTASSECSYYNIFAPHSFERNQENEFISNNMTIDYYFGHRKIVEQFAKKRKEFLAHYQSLRNLSNSELARYVDRARKKSVLLTVVMLTGKCDANCKICCTDRTYKDDEELKIEEISPIFKQVKKLGCKTIYIPGEGEPLLDKNIWNILDLSRQMKFNVIIFTNGIILSNNNLARNQWGMTSEEVVRKLSAYPVYIYHKLWSTDEMLLSELMQIPRGIYSFSTFFINGNDNKAKRTIMIPKGISLLLKYFPPDRVGIESVVTKQNFQELKNIIIPFIKQSGIKSYIEPLIHGGRCLGIHDYDLESSKHLELHPWLCRLGCRRLGYKVFISNAGYASFGIQVPLEKYLPERKHEFSIRNGKGKVKDIYNLVHSNELLVRGRYAMNGCLCEKISVNIEKHGFSEFLRDG